MAFFRYMTKAQIYRHVERLRRAFGIAPEDYPLGMADLRALAKGRAELRVHVFDSATLGAYMIKNPPPRRSLIVLNGRRPPLSQAFDLAHELVHFYTHPAGNFFCEIPEDGKVRRDLPAMEYQANQGAAELLMPYRLVIPMAAELADAKRLWRDPAMERRLGEAVAERFRCSPWAGILRIGDLRHELAQFRDGAALDRVRVLSMTARCRMAGARDPMAYAKASFALSYPKAMARQPMDQSELRARDSAALRAYDKEYE